MESGSDDILLPNKESSFKLKRFPIKHGNDVNRDE
jgi:hypothetical protein